VVVVDRVGADFRVVDGGGRVLSEEQVTGREHPMHKVRGGGWSHRSMQSHVEETVKRNVHEVAEETARLARLVNARVVIVAGEVQARSAVLAALPESAKQVAVEGEAGSRASGTDEQALSQEIEAVLDRLAEDDKRDLLDRFHAESGRQDGLGVQGLAATAAALREGNAEVLLADSGRLQPQTVWSASDDHTLLGVSAGELPDLGAAEVVERRADEAIPFAAVAVDAQLFVSDGMGLMDGVGLLLRYR
jgi:peptide subunit release factor 1 (eRF1)